MPPTMAEVPEIKRAFDVAQQSRLSREELEILEKREIFLHDSRNVILKTQIQAEQKGLERVFAEGSQEKAKQIARSLLNILDIETIGQTTGLSIAEIEQLR